jgi:hypothetical protein
MLWCLVFGAFSTTQWSFVFSPPIFSFFFIKFRLGVGTFSSKIDKIQLNGCLLLNIEDLNF